MGSKSSDVLFILSSGAEFICRYFDDNEFHLELDVFILCPLDFRLEETDRRREIWFVLTSSVL